MTGFPAIMATVTRREAVVHRVDIMPMGRRTVLLLIITSDGLARSRICRSAFDLPASVVGYFKRLSDAYIIGKELNDFTPAYLQRLVMMCGDLALLMTPLVSSVFEIVEELRSKTISVKGESNLMKCYSNEYDARALLGLLTRQELLFSLLAGTNENVEIVFGDKTGIEELRPSNIVVAKYTVGGEDIGRIGVLGPARMAYEQIIPSVEYFAEKLGEVMTQAINDLDE